MICDEILGTSAARQKVLFLVSQVAPRMPAFWLPARPEPETNLWPALFTGAPGALLSTLILSSRSGTGAVEHSDPIHRGPWPVVNLFERPDTHPARQGSPAARSLQTQRATHLALPPAGRDSRAFVRLACPGKRERIARRPHALASAQPPVVRFSLSRRFATPSRQFTSLTNQRAPRHALQILR